MKGARGVLTYIKLSAPGDGYAFPKEVTVDGEKQTIIDMNLLNPENGGVDEICIKNNSLAGQFGALVYGTPYVSYNINANQKLSKTYQRERYLIPSTFTPPMNDSLMMKDSYVQSSYDIMCGAVVINEQMWGSWKQTKEVYNTIQNFTFQGGLAFAVSTNPALSGGFDQILSSAQQQIFTTDNTLSYNFGNISNLGSGNLGNVLMSNLRNLKLDELSNSNVLWYPPNGNTGINGFWLNNRNIIMDFRGLGLVNGTYSGKPGWIEYYIGSIYSPSTAYSNEISALTNINTNINASNSISPQKFFVLNSMSMLNVHQLEINYRDGIIYTNTNQGQGGVWNMIKNWFCGVADKIIGYTPGYSNFFLNTYARTYNLFIPSSLAPLFNQYLDPSGDNYNAVPLDIFANTNENNTSVGQLKYISGYQFKLTDTYYSTNGDLCYTTGWRNTTTDNLITIPNTDLQAPKDSFIFFSEPLPPQTPTSYIINSINVKQIGQSNLHITYYKNVNNILQSVSEEWLLNTAKLMNNTSYIDNQIDYYCYDEYNIKPADNVEPYFTIQQQPAPVYQVNSNKPNTIPSQYLTPGKHMIKPLTTSPILGVSVEYNYSDGDIDSAFTVNFPSDYVFDYNFSVSYSYQGPGANTGASWGNNFSGPPIIPSIFNSSTPSNPINNWYLKHQWTLYNAKTFTNSYTENYHPWYYDACNNSSTTITNQRIPLIVESDYSYGATIGWSWDASGYNWNDNPTVNTYYGVYGAVVNYGVTNINYLTTTVTNNLPFQLPNTYKSNYVLIPHGADPNTYLDNWSYNDNIDGDESILLLDNNNQYFFSLSNFPASSTGYNGVPVLGGMSSANLPNVTWPERIYLNKFNCLSGSPDSSQMPQPFYLTPTESTWGGQGNQLALSNQTNLLSSTEYDMYLFYVVD